LRAYAAGVCAVEAAVGLLIAHRHWLTRADFVGEFVSLLPADSASAGDVPMALVDWPGAVAAVDVRLVCSRSEAAMVRIAASLAGAGAVELGWVLTRLDEVNVARVVAAVAHAGGQRGARVPAVPGGRFGW